MINYLRFIQTIVVGTESGSQIFFVDPEEEKVFDISLKEAPIEISSSIFSKIDEQVSDSLPSMPLKEFYEVLNTEKKLSEDNDKHIFRRN